MKMWDFVFPYIGSKTTQTQIPVHSPLKPQNHTSEWLLTNLHFLTNLFLYFVVQVSLTRLRYEYVSLTKILLQFGPRIHLELVTHNNYTPFRCSKLQSLACFVFFFI